MIEIQTDNRKRFRAWMDWYKHARVEWFLTPDDGWVYGQVVSLRIRRSRWGRFVGAWAEIKPQEEMGT